PLAGVVVIDCVLPERRLLAAVPAVEIDPQPADVLTGRRPRLLLHPACRCLGSHGERGTDPLILICLLSVDLEGPVPAQGGLSSRGSAATAGSRRCRSW